MESITLEYGTKTALIIALRKHFGWKLKKTGDFVKNLEELEKNTTFSQEGVNYENR